MDWKIGLAATAAAVALAASGSAQAALLTFEGDICNGGGVCTNGGLIDQTYGDIGSVDVQYNYDITDGNVATGDDAASLRYWDDFYNELEDVAYGSTNDLTGTPMIFLNPLGGNSVTLLGFDLGAWPNAVINTQITILDGLGATLFSSGPLTIGTGNVSSHFNFNLTSSNGIAIQWGPSGYNVGIDNVSFSATGGVPEPATWGLMIGGFGLAGAALRSRRRVSA